MTAKVFFNTHFEAFLNFASKEPRDRIIYHHKNGWCGCAVGDYHREATSEPPRGSQRLVPNEMGIQSSPLLTELEEDHGLIFEALNHGDVPEDMRHDFEIQTYHGLALFMAAFEGQTYDAEYEEMDD